MLFEMKFCILYFLFGVFAASATALENDDADLRGMIKILQHEIRSLNIKLKANEEITKTQIAAVEAENAMFKAQALDEFGKISRLEEAVQKAQNNTEIAAASTFLATIGSSSVSIGNGDPIVWDTEVINPGGNFNPSLGLYQAPVHGYYSFAVTKSGNNYDGRFNFLVNEMEYSLLDMDLISAGDSTPATSATINLELFAGDVVRIENLGSTLIYGINGEVMHSWFTGHLLYAL